MNAHMSHKTKYMHISASWYSMRYLLLLQGSLGLGHLALEELHGGLVLPLQVHNARVQVLCARQAATVAARNRCSLRQVENGM